MSLITVKNKTDKPVTVNGITIPPNEETLVPSGGSIDYLMSRGKIEIIKKNVKLHERSYLESLSMKELREIGDKVGAKDTKKSELIEEIIKNEVKLYA